MNWYKVISRLSGVKNDYSMLMFVTNREIKIDDSLKGDFYYLFPNTFGAKGNKKRLKQKLLKIVTCEE